MGARKAPPALMALAALAGCAGAAAGGAKKPFAPVYRGVEIRSLDGDLHEFVVEMEGARGPSDVTDYARCAAARYALIRGFGFARHVRTRINEEAGVWRADAVYTVSPALPGGLRTLDAEVVVADCGERGIPTV